MAGATLEGVLLDGWIVVSFVGSLVGVGCPELWAAEGERLNGAWVNVGSRTVGVAPLPVPGVNRRWSIDRCSLALVCPMDGCGSGRLVRSGRFSGGFDMVADGQRYVRGQWRVICTTQPGRQEDAGVGN